MRMPSSSRRLCANLAILLLIFAGIPTLFSQAAWGTWHTGSNTLAAAKKMARDSNRPLLVVAGAINCAHCETLEENVLHTAEMHNFAYNNKVVLFECRDLQKLSDRLHVNYGKACGMSKTYPYSFLFRVNPDADVTNVNWKSLDPSEVTLLAVASGPYAGSKSGFTYAAAKSINGIRIENEANWKASTYIEVLKSYFPNQQWATIVPPAGGDDPPPGGDDPPPGGDDPPPGGDDPPPGGDDPPIGPIDDSLWGGIWLQTNQLAQAKAYALANNRPLLVVAGAINCAHCDSLERMVLHTAEFRNYAKEKKIVLFECRDLKKLSDRLSVNYGKACGMSKTYPYSFLFTVNPGADLTTSDWKSLDPSEVTLLTIASGFYAGNKSGFNYAAVKSINGIKLEAEANWKAATYIAVLESFFPNQQWATINPPAAPPLSGYENAINLGRIPSLEYPPATASKWITYSVNQSLTTAVNERWYKFTGDLNKRYVFSAKDIINANPGVNITFTLYASTLVNGVSTPKTPALKTVTSLGFDALDRGIQVDMSTGTATNLTFLLRIKHDDSAPMNDMFYTLKVHEAQRAPAPGTVTNPHWAGAVPGQWTMDRTAAEAQSLIDGKPIIYLFSGLLWCPYCVGLDHNVLQTPAFAAATANAYLVALDNRDRYGNGPSLLRDNTTGGYLETNSIDENEAEAKLEDNIAVQNALALPTATAWGPGDAWKKIGYPTLVYCVPTAGGTRATFNGLATVGRISGDYEADSVIAKLNDLAIMAADGFVEDNTFASLSTQEIGTDSPVNSRIGGSLIAADWWQFTVSPDMAAAFTAQSDNPPAEAMITLTVYSEDGLTALKTLTAPANVAARLDFAPPMSTGGTFWLRVSATGANASFAYTLTFAEASLNYKLAMATEEIYVSRRHEEATVTVRIIEQKANDQDIRFRYRVIAAPENALNEFYFTATDWSEVTIPHADKPAGEINLTAAYHIPAEVPLWTDSRDFIIEIDAVAGGNAQVDGTASRTIVKVMSTTVFAPRPTVTSFDLIKDVPVSGLVFPVCVGGTANNVLLPGADAALPAGLNVEWVDDPAQPRIVISGAPTELDAVGKTVRLGLFTDIDHVDNLDVHFTVSDMPPSGSITAFAGYLTSMLDDTAARAIRGDIKIDNDLNGPTGKITLRVATQDTAAPVEFTADAWTGYSPAAGNLVLDLVDNGTGARLLLYVAPDGNVSGTYTSPQAIPYSIHAAARSDIPEEYEGYYTVALRELNEDDTYNFHGWLQVEVNAAGVVTYQGEMIDGTAIGPQTTYITPSVNIDVAPDKKPYGDLIFFQPLYWSEELGKFSGRLAGRLVIFPKTDREGEGINDAWISACYGNEVDNPIWEKSAHDQVCLDPCGTVFDSTRSVAAQVDPDSESPYFYFNVQTPAAAGIVIPDHILLEEIPATPAMTIAAEGILAAELSDLAYNKDTGVLTGTINVLNAANGSALNRTECAIRGILTPITSDCCRETADLAVGYGYFDHQNATYIITLNATAVLAAEAPTLVDLEGQAGPDFNVVFQKAAVSLTIDAPTQKVLRRETDLDGNTSLFLYDWTDEYETNKEFTLPTLRQEFVGLEDGKAESDILAIPLTPAEAVATFAVPDADGNVPDGAIAVQPGWNLLGVPWDIKLAADYVPGPGWKACDPIQNAFVPASALETGAAYWIFIKDNTLPFDIPGLLLMQPTPMPPDAPAEWRCIADPGQGTRWFWVDGQFTTDPPEQPKWQGVWHYPDH
jgi:thioredoxin-related protein/thiol-disulfide isomerase/thioredoxin